MEAVDPGKAFTPEDLQPSPRVIALCHIEDERARRMPQRFKDLLPLRRLVVLAVDPVLRLRTQVEGRN